jgi:hypothetical protein
MDNGFIDDLVVENSITVLGDGKITAGTVELSGSLKLGVESMPNLQDNCTVWVDGGNGTATLCTPPNGSEAGKHQLYVDNDTSDPENPKGVLLTAHNGLRIDVTNTSHLKIHNSEGLPVTIDVAEPKEASHAASKEYVDFHAGSTLMFGASYLAPGHRFLIPGGPSAGATDIMVSIRVPRKGIVRNLYGQIDLPGCGSGKATFVVQVNGVDTSLAATDVADNSSGFQNNTDSMAVCEGDRLSVKVYADDAFVGGKFCTVCLDFMPANF